MPESKSSTPRWGDPCKNPECGNVCRYSSGYCGLCDLLKHDGGGKRLERKDTKS
jgi:hypothetical protein